MRPQRDIISRADSYLAAAGLRPGSRHVTVTSARGFWDVCVSHNLIELIRGGAGAVLGRETMAFYGFVSVVSERETKRCCPSLDTRIQAAVNGDR